MSHYVSRRYIYTWYVCGHSHFYHPPHCSSPSTMSECECSSVIPLRRHNRDDEENALQLAPRKKLYFAAAFETLIAIDHFDPVATLTPSFTTSVILVERSTLCATFVLYSETASANFDISIHRTTIITSSVSLVLLPNLFYTELSSSDKERRVFNALLIMIPGLQTRLFASSAEEVRLIADLVCLYLCPLSRCLPFPLPRSRRVSQAQDPTTPRASKVLSLTGSPLWGNLSSPLLRATSKQIVVSTTNVRDFFSVLLD